MNFKIKLARVIVRYQWKQKKRISFKNNGLSDEENALVKLIKIKAVCPSTQILIAPLSNKRYIMDKENKLFIIMENSLFTVITESNKLQYYLPVNVSDYLWIYVDKVVEKKRQLFEKEINRMVTFSLNKIINNNLN